MKSESESKVWAWQRVYARVKSLSMAAMLSMALSLFVRGVTNMEDAKPASPFNQNDMNKMSILCEGPE